MDYRDNVGLLHWAADRIIEQEKLESNTKLLEHFLSGVDHVESALRNGMESSYLREVIEEATCQRRSVRATRELYLLRDLMLNK